MLNKYFPIIFITLGRDCNFNCKYCLQDEKHFHQRKNIVVPELSQKLLNFLDKYQYNDTKIMFWGGEPLLYIDSIKKLLERYGKKFKWGTVTNGSLLNENIVSLFDKHNVSFVISHDGKATEYTREIDILKNEKIKKLLENSKSFSGFSSVYSSCNNNYRQLFSFFDQIGFKNKNIVVDMIYNTSDTLFLNELANINKEDYKKTLLELFWGYEQQEFYNNNDYFKEWLVVKEMLNKLDLTIKYKSKSSNRHYNIGCATCKRVLNIDWNGDVYICHNSTYKIGTVKDNHETLHETFIKYLETKFTPKCKNCDIYGLCEGACLLLTEKGQESFCNLRKIKTELLCNWLSTLENKLSEREKDRN